ncbi:MAG: PDZ domain-containing protein, partial [Acidobacteria bacterium]|nr:PDZ domain-containing protein [Acidobacteriota bacterium]
MKGSVLTTRTWVLLIAAALLVAAGALNFAQRLTHTPPPTDGVDWVETEQGLVARSVAPNSAASRAGIFGIMPGDRLLGVSLNEVKDEEVVSASDVQVYLEEAKVGGRLRYLIERPSFPEETRFYHVYLENLGAIENWTTRDLYINFVGVVYLLVGLFVLFKQGGRAPFVLHFATLCLVAFVFHFYKPVGEYEDLDLAIAFLDDAALALFAPLFLHFCAIYPVRYHLSGRRRWPAVLLYAPAFVLVALIAFFDFALTLRPRLPSALFDFVLLLYRGLPEDFYARFSVVATGCLTAALVAGASILVLRLLRSETAVVRQQLKWVVWGSVLAVAPFTMLYALGYLFGGLPYSEPSAERWLTDAAVLPLILIPLTFGNSVVRYRLMDVDMVVRRTAVYALTTLTIALMIGGVIFGIVIYGAGLYPLTGDVLTTGISTLRIIVVVVAMAAIVMSAAPLKNFLQERTDRFFYGESYDLRNGLLDFGRTLSATTALDPLLDALASRLQQVLGVERVAIFIEDPRSSSGYRVARSVGLSNGIIVPPDFREMIRTRSAETGIVRADDLDLQPDT